MITLSHGKEDYMELDLRSLYRLIKSNFLILLITVFVISSATAVISYLFIEPTYEAKAKMIANSSNGSPEALYDLETIELNIRLLKIYKEIILTSSIVEIVSKDYPELKIEPEELKDKIEIDLVSDTPLMNITVKDSSYKRAVGILEAVTTVFLEKLPTIMKGNNVSILNQSESSAKVDPVSPNGPFNIIIAAFTSFIFTIVWLLVKERFDETIKSEEDIQKELGLDTLGVIVRLEQKDWLRSRSMKYQHKEREGTDVSTG
jgi:capsular polysaccharide biosynthesis protein